MLKLSSVAFILNTLLWSALSGDNNSADISLMRQLLYYHRKSIVRLISFQCKRLGSSVPFMIQFCNYNFCTPFCMVEASEKDRSCLTLVANNDPTLVRTVTENHLTNMCLRYAHGKPRQVRSHPQSCLKHPPGSMSPKRKAKHETSCLQ